jgi:translocation and assembly module TamB
VKALRISLVALGALLVLVAAALAWTLKTQSGARWAAARAESALGGKLTLGEVYGTIAGPLTVTGVHYRDVESGKDVRVGRATVDVALRELLSTRVRVRSLEADGIDVRLTEPTKPPPEKKPMSLDPPIDILLDRVAVTNARIEQKGKPRARVTRAFIAARWTDAGIEVRRLEVDAREGFVRFDGSVDERLDRYLGRGAGRFRWTLGELSYAGALKVRSDARAANAHVELTQPVSARVSATVQQRTDFPWHLRLDVDRFDPRKRLHMQGSLERLAADLEASGDRDEATLRGEVLVNGERVRIEPLQVALAGERIDIRTLVVRVAGRPGTLQASGNVRRDVPPFFADVVLRWRDVVLPPEWVGQPLATRGTLAFEGHPARYDADGTLSVGPPGRLSEIRLAARGSAEAVELRRLTVRQPRGHLSAQGVVQLKPVRWRVDAEARHFDPGQLFVAWPGDVGFDLASVGRMTRAGPIASLELRNLGGNLRHRPISGEADLDVTAARVVAGTLRLASGRSEIRIVGKPGDRLDLSADIEVASLDDWLPGARGTFNGQVDAAGNWPDVRIDGTLRGDRLAIADSKVAIIHGQFEVENPRDPSGTLTLSGRGIDTGGFSFGEIGLHAKGSAADHLVRVRARGTPLSAAITVSGARRGAGWAGTVQELSLAAKDAPRLGLREPVRASIDGTRFSVSESCLAGRDVAICAEGAGDTRGEMRGRYTIENLPLALVRVLAAPEMPLALGGALQGTGTVRRAADGALYGNAEISSPEGRVMQLEIAEEPLLTWQDVRLTARLDGDTANGALQGALGGGGRLDAQASAAGLNSAAPRMKGRAEIVIGDLRSVEVFTPQLAAVKGRVEARGSFDGTPDSFGIAAEARVREFAAELPALGLKLRDGNFDASMQPASGARFSGSISSADGQVKVDGTADPTGVIKATIRGNQVLAADIPAGRIIVDPELTFSRTPELARLEGKVVIPDAKIDLTKLPQGGRVRPSPDVVVIDEPAVEKQQDEFPLYTHVTIEVGPEVELNGFGLEAQVGGVLTVREKPGDEPRASGEIRLEGTYKAYGQNLTIEEGQGRLVYAGNALNDPRLDIRAVRKVPPVTAILLISGTALRPELEVTSDPAMSQTEALSYLVRGKPMNELGGEDADLMQTAARSLGGAAGNLLAKNIGKRLGIDEIGIQQSEELGGSAFTVGEYLSPKLYLSYGFGLFEPGEVVTLRYELSDEFSLRVSQGTEDQRAGIEYRIEH